MLHFDFVNGCKWDVTYFGEDSMFHNLDDDFRISLLTPDGKEITIDVIPPEAMQALYDAIGTTLKERTECLKAYQEQEEAAALDAAEIEREELAGDDEPPERLHLTLADRPE